MVLFTACAPVETEEVSSTSVPETPTILTNTQQISSASPTALISTQTDIPTMTIEPTHFEDTSSFNVDGSWYFEYFPRFANLKIFQENNPDPILEINLLEFFPDYPVTSYPERSGGDVPYLGPRHNPVWSPDGRYLAFLGAIEGPSSDLYIFDTDTQTIARLTSGENQAVCAEWSPDSEWIIHGEMVFTDYDEEYNSLWAAKADGSEVRWLYSPQYGSADIYKWIDQSSFYSYEISWCGFTAFRLINLEKNSIITIFDLSQEGCGGVMTFQFDANSGAVVYQFVLPDTSTMFQDWDLYLTTPWAPSPRWMLPENYEASQRIYAWDEELGIYVAYNGCDDNEDLFFAFNPQGEVFCIEYTP